MEVSIRPQQAVDVNLVIVQVFQGEPCHKRRLGCAKGSVLVSRSMWCTWQFDTGYYEV